VDDQEAHRGATAVAAVGAVEVDVAASAEAVTLVEEAAVVVGSSQH